MKIRNGFVSNSSTSSFLIYGKELSPEDATRLMGRECVDHWEIGGDDIREKLGKTCLKIVYGEESTYLGCSWDSVSDDETGKQFKDRIEADVKKLLGDEATCSTCREAWQDG
jgi:hypothetical protein